MKIMQVLPSLQVGGVERGVIDIVRALKRLGHESVVVSSGGDLVAELKKIGVPHYTLPIHQKTLFGLGLVSKLADIIRREQVEIVHARSRVPGWIVCLATRRTGVPFVTTCHGYYSTHPLSHVMGWGKRVIVISRVVGRHMIDHFNVSPERIRLVHRGVDLSQFQKENERYRDLQKPSAGPFRIINIGRLSPIKGQVEFLHAIHYLRREVQSVEVWLVGSEGKGKHKYTQLLEKTIRQLGLESCVKLLGTRRDIPELLAQSDLLVLSTLVPEAFGRVLIEAGAVGTPVLSTHVGGVLDVIDHGENGILVPCGDVEAMGKAIKDLLMNRALARRLAQHLREKVRSRFTLEQMVEQTVKVYEEVKHHRKILILKLGAMGDVILAVPSLRMIRKKFPDARISLLVDRKFSPLVSVSPYVDEVIPIDRDRLSHPGYFLKLCRRLRREGFDMSIDFQNSKWTHLLGYFSGIGDRYGFMRGRTGFLLNHPDPHFDSPEPPVQNQARILAKLGIRSVDERLELWPDPESEDRVAQWLGTAQNGHDRYIGLVLGSSPKWETKRWPAEFFKNLAGKLVLEKNCKIVLIGAAEDAACAGELSQWPAGHTVNLIGKTSPKELVSLVGRLKVMVTGDTAPLHVASAMGVRIVALFGPTDPRRHVPPGEHIHVVARSLACQPCYRGTCSNHEKFACMRQISVEEVHSQIRKYLAETA
ncbi:MAG: hypothetical protein A2Z83_08495 [Omnitrophica bacterium GWA2_52_8]|nr:MAG: hypothetical protein A2Z83_08495 [Omnitrophica bacterium GWA2_52_8]